MRLFKQKDGNYKADADPETEEKSVKALAKLNKNLKRELVDHK